jgi:hypothetical protein
MAVSRDNRAAVNIRCKLCVELQFTTTLHPCSGVGAGHRENGSNVQMNGLVYFGGLDPSRRKSVSWGSTFVAMHRSRSRDSEGPLWSEPRPGPGDSVVSSHDMITLAVVQPSIRQSSYCTANPAFNCLMFREADRSAWGTSTGPGGAQPNPDSIAVSTVQYGAIRHR